MDVLAARARVSPELPSHANNVQGWQCLPSERRAPKSLLKGCNASHAAQGTRSRFEV